MADFEAAFTKTLNAEGGYKLTNIVGDRGGMTFAGISRNAHPTWAGWVFVDKQDIAAAKTLVQGFYRINFWDPIKGAEIAHQRVAESVYDFAVNAGVKSAVKLVQKDLGLVVDGQLGPKTLAALNHVNGDEYVKAFAFAKIGRYADICNADREQSKFLLGWLNRTLHQLKA